MSTRGAYGFYINGEEKVTYNHSDSYPSWLGKKILDYIRSHSDEQILEVAKRIVLVDEDEKATDLQIQECQQWAVTHMSIGNMGSVTIGTGRMDDWYNLLHETQGNLAAYDSGLRYMIDYKDFLRDSLFCEWAYIINLNTKSLEIYCGFNKDKNALGRYVKVESPEQGYYGVRLLREITLNDVREMPDTWIDNMLADLRKSC